MRHGESCRQLNEMATLTATAQDRTAMKAKNELWTALIKLYRSLEGFWRPDYTDALAEKGEKLAVSVSNSIRQCQCLGLASVLQ